MKPRNWPTYERALRLRQEGKTLREVGKILGLSSERVRQMEAQVLFRRVKDKLIPHQDMLSMRSINCLYNLVYECGGFRRDLPLDPLVVHKLNPGFYLTKRPNAGEKTIKEISAWLNVCLAEKRVKQ